MNSNINRRSVLRAMITVCGVGLTVTLPSASVAAGFGKGMSKGGRSKSKLPATVKLSSRYGGHLGSKVNVPISKLRARPGSHLAKLEFRAASRGANQIGAVKDQRNPLKNLSNTRKNKAKRAVGDINSYKASKRQFSSLHASKADASFKRVLRKNRNRINFHVASQNPKKPKALKLVDRSPVEMGVVYSARSRMVKPAYNVRWQLRTAGKRIYPHSAEAF